MDIKIYFFLFLIYSVMGWCMEVTLGIINNKKFVNRGFLIGPYCPIYGWGGTLITILLNDFKDYPIAVFSMAIVICGVLEYLTSFFMEKIFKARWWDYSKNKFNINGRVCLETIIPFGLLSCMIIYITNPFFIGQLERVSDETLKIWYIVCLSIFSIDSFVSLVVISGLRKTVKEVNIKHTTDNTEEITNKVKEILLGKSILDRRLIKAFPKISIEDVKKRIKETTEQVKENVTKATESAAEYIKESATQVKESTIKIKDEVADHIKEGATKVIEGASKVKESASKVKETIEERKKNDSKENKK